MQFSDCLSAALCWFHSNAPHFEMAFLRLFIKLFKNIYLTRTTEKLSKPWYGIDEWGGLRLCFPRWWREPNKAAAVQIPSSPSSLTCVNYCAQTNWITLASCGSPLPSLGQGLLDRSKPFPFDWRKYVSNCSLLWSPPGGGWSSSLWTMNKSWQPNQSTGIPLKLVCSALTTPVTLKVG